MEINYLLKKPSMARNQAYGLVKEKKFAILKLYFLLLKTLFIREEFYFVRVSAYAAEGISKNWRRQNILMVVVANSK